MDRSNPYANGFVILFWPLTLAAIHLIDAKQRYYIRDEKILCDLSLAVVKLAAFMNGRNSY